MKKTTQAATKKTAAKAVKKAAPEVVAPVVKKVAAKKAAATKVVATTVVATPAKKVATPVKKPAAPAPVAKTPSLPKTTIVATVDVGFGNSLFLRGDAPGLSWSKGVPMDSQSESVWSISIAGVTEAFEFKVLINDSYWSAGYNLTATPGATVEIAPAF